MQGKTLSELAHNAFDERRRLVAPLAGFPGVEMIDSNIKIAQQNYGEHYKAIRKLVDTFQPDLVFPLMDLAVEANALGRYTIFPKADSATVPKDQFSILELDRLKQINITFDSRLMGYVEMMKLMSVTLPLGLLKGGYVVGPFTLAGRRAAGSERAPGGNGGRAQFRPQHRLRPASRDSDGEHPRVHGGRKGLEEALRWGPRRGDRTGTISWWDNSFPACSRICYAISYNDSG